ncbi:hypothetical protein QQF64_018517 [Cirrhinus molitorella]|uniref:Integrase core domain-containing protein n=1 Tax=Cirrhinus molitorella TaxID=172907 RepID=A0ABR3LFF0_9TELE
MSAFDYARLGRTGVDVLVGSAVTACGPVCGRKVMTGMLRASGFRLGERRIRRALAQVMRREGTTRQINPHVYYAEYAGHKLHMDQNEKLIDFGVTEILASDGFSGKIMGYSVMPIKNNLTIYDEVYREICLNYGLFDQLRVDHGREFYLCLYQQDNLEAYRTNTHRLPFIQSQSRQNHAAERKWVEINARINYPIKNVLCSLTNNGLLDIDDPCVKNCVSYIASKCCLVGLQNFVSAWNAHTIPHKGIPDALFAAHLRTARIPSHLIAAVVAANYVSNGGTLTYPSLYGQDPLDRYPDRQLQRENLWSSAYQFDHLFYATLVGNSGLFWDALDMYMSITHSLEP